MRVNVYEEELTDDVQIVETTAEEDKTFYGVRVFLLSSDSLHHSSEDDDRSAVTFWVNTYQRAVILQAHLRRDLNLVITGGAAGGKG